jgi:hypothetical protein
MLLCFLNVLSSAQEPSGTPRKNVALVQKRRKTSVERSFFAECPCLLTHVVLLCLTTVSSLEYTNSECISRQKVPGRNFGPSWPRVAFLEVACMPPIYQVSDYWCSIWHDKWLDVGDNYFLHSHEYGFSTWKQKCVHASWTAGQSL